MKKLIFSTSLIIILNFNFSIFSSQPAPENVFTESENQILSNTITNLIDGRFIARLPTAIRNLIDLSVSESNLNDTNIIPVKLPKGTIIMVLDLALSEISLKLNEIDKHNNTNTQDIENIKYILQNTRNGEGFSLMDIATIHRDIDIAQKLIDLGVNINQIPPRNNYCLNKYFIPLDYTQKNQPALIQKHGSASAYFADENQPAKIFTSAMWIFDFIHKSLNPDQVSRIKMLYFFLKNGYDVTILDGNCYSILYWALSDMFKHRLYKDIDEDFANKNPGINIIEKEEFKKQMFKGLIKLLIKSFINNNNITSPRNTFQNLLHFSNHSTKHTSLFKEIVNDLFCQY